MSKKINKDVIEKLKQNSTKLVVEFEDKITHEQAQHCFDVIKYETFDTQTMDITDLLEYFYKLKKYIEQQEKQEKLLELYKKLSNRYEEFYNMELSRLCLNSNYYGKEIFKVKQQIKELENE